MNLDIDSGKLLYAIGVLLAIAALLYFIQDLVFGLSITVKAALLFMGFVAFFVAGTATNRDLLDVVAFALSGVSYLVFLLYVFWRYEVGEGGTFLLLAVSAALFIGLGYLLRERELRTPVRVAGYLIGGLLLVSVALVGADAAGGGVTYDVQTDDSVIIGPAGEDRSDREYAMTEVQVGSVTATNQFVFRRLLDLPGVAGCVVGGDALGGREGRVSYEGYSSQRANAIGGGQSLSFDLTADVPVATNTTEPTTYLIERRTDCPDETDQPTIAVITDDRFE